MDDRADRSRSRSSRRATSDRCRPRARRGRRRARPGRGAQPRLARGARGVGRVPRRRRRARRPAGAPTLAADLDGAGADVGRLAGRGSGCRCRADRRPTDWERNVAGLERARWATADMAYRREALAAVGGFDERFPRAYREDADLGLRLTGAGWRIVRGRRTVLHPVGAGRPARVSLAKQAGNADDVLMRRAARPRLARAGRRAARPPPAAPRDRGGGRGGRRRGRVAARRARALAAAAGAAWLAGTAELAWARIAPGPRTARRGRDDGVDQRGDAVRRDRLVAAASARRRRDAAGAGAAAAAAGGPVRPRRDARRRRALQRRPGARRAGARRARRRSTGCAPRACRTGVVSNQSGVARGLLTRAQVRARSTRGSTRCSARSGPSSGARTAPATAARCRKPAPGLVLRAAARLGVDPRALRGGRRHRRRRRGGAGGRRARRPRADAAHARARRSPRRPRSRPTSRAPSTCCSTAGSRRPRAGADRGGTMTRVLAVRLDNDGDVLLAGPAIRALAARRRPRDAAVRAARAAGGGAAAGRRRGRQLARAVDRPRAGPGRRARDVDALVERVARAAGSTRAIVFGSFHQSPLPTALLLRLAGVPRIAATSVDYPGSLLDVRHRIDDDVHEVERSLDLVARRGLRRSRPATTARSRVARRAAPRGRPSAVRRRAPGRLGAGARVGARPQRRAGRARSPPPGAASSSPAGPAERALTALVAGAAARRRPRRRARLRRAGRRASPAPARRRRQHRPGAPRRRRRHAGRLALRADRAGRPLAAVARAARAARTSTSRAPAAARATARSPGHPCLGGVEVADVVAAVERLAPRGGGGMRILLWHVHGAWTTAFVQAATSTSCRSLPDRGPDGVGLARTCDWPRQRSPSCRPSAWRDEDFDVVVLQRPHELERLAPEWLGRARPRPPGGLRRAQRAAGPDRRDAPSGRRPRRTSLLVHVTHFNALFWDAGSTPTRVIEHGIVDPGDRYTGELPRAAVVINEARRRGRVTGTDLLDRFAARGADRPVRDRRRAASAASRTCRSASCTTAMARRRVYLHPIRWTSLGLSLLEAMHLGMPVVALGTTEAHEAVPPAAGVGLDAARRAGRRDAAADRRPRRGARARRAPPAPRRSSATGWSASSPTGTRCSRRWRR